MPKITAKDVRAKEIRNMANQIKGIFAKDKGTPTIGAKASSIVAWIMATVEPPRALPIATEVLEIGATRTSFRKPNSLSQIIEIAEKVQVNKRLIPIMPG